MDIVTVSEARLVRPQATAAALPDADSLQLAVIGLGYVGLPLAAAFGRDLPVVGFDIDDGRVTELRAREDRTRQVSDDELCEAAKLEFSSDEARLGHSNVFIVTVPTPVDQYKRPDLSMLRQASSLVGRSLKRGSVVVYESTVYPGATEEVCVPILEHESGLTFNQDFYVGYSPERINPGDREHGVSDIVKVTSGSTPQVAEFVDELYARIIRAGTYKASSIRVAEAAKVIENTQRDINIALINELARLFHLLDIDTREVLDAAATKWNFLPFTPGLVGGHCIGVDPYYLAAKAQEIGYFPEMTLVGRRLNDSMGSYVAERVFKMLTRRRVHVVGARILVLGLAFKQNCPDLRNTQVIDLVRDLQHFGANVDVHDPWVDPEECKREYAIELCREPASACYDAIVLAVAHQDFLDMGSRSIRRYGRSGCLLFDVMGALPADEVDGRL